LRSARDGIAIHVSRVSYAHPPCCARGTGFLSRLDKGVTFEFVQKIARRFKNTGVVVIRDLEAFVAQSDEELNATLLGPELVEWLRS